MFWRLLTREITSAIKKGLLSPSDFDGIEGSHFTEAARKYFLPDEVLESCGYKIELKTKTEYDL